MSYCVNCGVELDKTCSQCPLCHTPVYNPNQPIDTESPKPFPDKKGETEHYSTREFTILMSIICGTISVVCGLLNQIIFTDKNWSFYIIGLCALLWIFLLPSFFPERISRLTSLLLNGISIAVFLFVISLLHPGKGWYLNIALPLTILATILVLYFYNFSIRRKSSFIAKTVLLFLGIAIFCVCIEILIDFHFQEHLSMTWSLIVLACCTSIDIILITISFLTGVRGELRRRLHF